MSLLPTKDELKKLSPAWWGAVAGAVAAGAALLPDSRLLGGAAGGVAMLLLARKLSAPCCAECAGASSSEAKALYTDAAAPSLKTGSAVAAGIACSDCSSSGIDEYS